MMVLWHAISFREPWFLLLALQPLLMWTLALLRRRWQHVAFADTALLPWVVSPQQVSGVRHYLRALAVLLAWLVFALAMAGPRILLQNFDTSPRDMVNLEVVIDTSFSMSANDTLPTRLQRAKLELQDLLDRTQQVRMGIIVYAGRAHVMLPPTTDKSVLRQAIDAIEVRQLPSEGSNMFAGLHMAQQQLQVNGATARAVLLISDGELKDTDAQVQQQVKQLVDELRQQQTPLYILGVGSAHGTALLNNQNGWLQQDGRTVVTRLHAKRLQSLAQASNGAFAEVADDASDWQTLYDNGIARLHPVAHEENTETAIWQDLSPWFVFPGMLLILLAHVRRPLPRDIGKTSVLLVAIGIGVMLHAPTSQAAEQDYAAAYAKYHAKQYEEAAREFARLPGYISRMAEAASLYQLQQYSRAAAVYIQAVLDANDDVQRAASLFNLGNTYFKQAAYVQAADSYRDALRYQPALAAAKINLSYAQALQQQAQTESLLEGRAGIGTHMAPTAPGTDVGKGRVSIDEHSTTPPSTPPAPTDTTPRQSGSSLGLLQQAKPVTQQIQRDADVSWTYNIRFAQDIPPSSIHFSVDEAIFWQRLYEAEEDFPAPLSKPVTLPGVRPW